MKKQKKTVLFLAQGADQRAEHHASGQQHRQAGKEQQPDRRLIGLIAPDFPVAIARSFQMGLQIAQKAGIGRELRHGFPVLGANRHQPEHLDAAVQHRTVENVLRLLGARVAQPSDGVPAPLVEPIALGYAAGVGPAVPVLWQKQTGLRLLLHQHQQTVLLKQRLFDLLQAQRLGKGRGVPVEPLFAVALIISLRKEVAVRLRRAADLGCTQSGPGSEGRHGRVVQLIASQQKALQSGVCQGAAPLLQRLMGVLGQHAEAFIIHKRTDALHGLLGPYPPHSQGQRRQAAEQAQQKDRALRVLFHHQLLPFLRCCRRLRRTSRSPSSQHSRP